MQRSIFLNRSNQVFHLKPIIEPGPHRPGFSTPWLRNPASDRWKPSCDSIFEGLIRAMEVRAVCLRSSQTLHAPIAPSDLVHDLTHTRNTVTFRHSH